MGQARQKRRIIEKKEEELRIIQKRTEELRATIAPMRKELDELTASMQPQFHDFCNRIGPRLFPEDSADVARFFLDNKVFELEEGGKVLASRIPDLIVGLSEIFVNIIRTKRRECEEAATFINNMDEISSFGKWRTKEQWKFASEVLGVIYARRVLSEKGKLEEGYDPDLYIPFKGLDWGKHMTKEETVRNAKLGITAFLHSHEGQLTGRALAAKKLVDGLPPQGRKEIKASLDMDVDGDFKALKEAVEPIFSKEYPVIQPDQRSKAFSALFEMTADWMQAGWMKNGRPFDADVDAVAYIAAERIFLKGYERTAEQEDSKTALFERRLLQMQMDLTGEALSAKGQYWKLSETEKKALQNVVDNMPPSLIVSFGKAIEEFIKKKRGGSWLETVDFQLVFEAVHDNSGLHETDIAPNMKEAFSYLVTEKLIRDGFRESLRQEEKGDKKEEKDPDYMPVVELWSDKELTTTGMTIWKQTYGAGTGDDEALERSREVAGKWGEDVGGRGVLVNEQRLMVVSAVIGFTAKWAVHAFQRITTTHTYAAALMCSDADRTVLEDIEMQWHAFMICVPNGLLSYEDEERNTHNEYNRVLVASFDHQATIVLLNQNGAKSSHRLVAQVSGTLADLLDVKDSELAHALGDDAVTVTAKSKIQRIIILAKRLVAGLLLALQNQNNFKSKVSPARDGKKQREPGTEPAHRVVFVGAPLKIDCRASVADYIKNGSAKRKGAPPQVQTLVRGHHKRQVCGVGRSGRKVIWIEPFWRGPEDAPILTRPKKVG